MCACAREHTRMHEKMRPPTEEEANPVISLPFELRLSVRTAREKVFVGKFHTETGSKREEKKRS